MNHDQKEIIQDYFNLERMIQSKKRRLEYVQLEFESINYCGSTVFTFNEGVQYRGFRVDTRVAGYVDTITTIERHIDKMERKQTYFKRFLSTLTNDALSSLKRRYKHYIGSIDDIQTMPSDKKVLDEIKEIEEAIKFQFKDDYIFNLKQDIQNKRGKNEQGKNNEQKPVSYAKVKQIENADFTDDTVEDSFDAITELLGV